MARNGKGSVRRPLLAPEENLDENWHNTFAKCSVCGSREDLTVVVQQDYFGRDKEVIVCAACDDDRMSDPE